MFRLIGLALVVFCSLSMATDLESTWDIYTEPTLAKELGFEMDAIVDGRDAEVLKVRFKFPDKIDDRWQASKVVASMRASKNSEIARIVSDYLVDAPKPKLLLEYAPRKHDFHIELEYVCIRPETEILCSRTYWIPSVNDFLTRSGFDLRVNE